MAVILEKMLIFFRIHAADRSIDRAGHVIVCQALYAPWNTLRSTRIRQQRRIAHDSINYRERLAGLSNRRGDDMEWTCGYQPRPRDREERGW
jgi:hypothetical protein